MIDELARIIDPVAFDWAARNDVGPATKGAADARMRFAREASVRIFEAIPDLDEKLPSVSGGGDDET